MRVHHVQLARESRGAGVGERGRDERVGDLAARRDGREPLPPRGLRVRDRALPRARQRIRPMLLQRIGGFQIGHERVLRAAFALRKATQTLPRRLCEGAAFNGHPL